MCALAASVFAIAQQAPEGMTRADAARRAEALAALGRRMFFDPSLSASGRVSCASCHDPGHAYAPSHALSVEAAGIDGRRQGFRAAPSLRYLQAVPAFTEHYFDSEGVDPGIDNGPTGGLTWDGRVDRGREQARIPLLSPFEMANAGPSEVVDRTRRAPYAAELRRLAGRDDEAARFATILEALEVWQQNDREFYPYSSKYDAWLAGKAQLTPRESRGLQLFNDPGKGACARCHISARGANGAPPQFTDYAFAALGVPRNRMIRRNADPQWFDLGLCGPERRDLREKSEYCGQFRTPSLRNVATRGAFFHNGVFHSLRDAVEFYASRDTDPARWYPRGADGAPVKFDDLPPRYRRNVETGPPFGRAPGAPPALTGEEVDCIVAFLGTLTDGYRPTP